jgi:hypothetical protein
MTRCGFSLNPTFRLGTDSRARRLPVVNVFVEFASGTSSALALLVANTTTCDRERETKKEDEDMKRGSVLAIFLGTALLAGVASASPKPSEDIPAPRIGDEDIQAPRSGNEDIQSPRGQQTPHDRNEDIQAPRG